MGRFSEPLKAIFSVLVIVSIFLLEKVPNIIADTRNTLEQCFSIFVRPRPGKFFFYETRARSQKIHS